MSDREVSEGITRVTAMTQPDGILEFLVELANKGITSHSISVVVGGAVISGTLVSGKEYAKDNAARIREAYGLTGDEKGLDLLFDQMAEEWEAPSDGEKTNEESESAPPPRYLHIKDGYTVAGDQLSFGDGCWWRLRIAEVSAWTFTQVSRAPISDAE